MRNRRRAVRLSDAVDYDRTADRGSQREAGDEDRMVIFEDDFGPISSGAEQGSLEFYREQQSSKIGRASCRERV